MKRCFFAIFFILLFCVLTSTLKAQESITKWLIFENPKNGDTLFISEPFNPAQVQLYLKNGDRDTLTAYQILPSIGIKILVLGYPLESKLILAYQIPFQQFFRESRSVLPFQASQQTTSLDSGKREPDFSSQSDDLFGNSKLSKSGSLTRGITVGSNQDVSLESGLQLDLSGEIADSVFLIANLTDQSTPIQPDGSTQNLREFDRVYLQLKSPRHLLEMGDIDVRFAESQFARINRRLQGAQYSTTVIPGKYQFLATVARGIFKTQSIQGQEGFQGPYRLTGLNGEPFIVVIAGTEKVYVNGRLLVRGEENDYVIDYALGELTFTTRQLINARTRITVDFQYLNQDFSRSLIATQAQSNPLWDGKIQLGVSYMRETDSDNTLSQLSLSPDDITLLEQAGDNPAKSVVSGVFPYVALENEQNRVPYQRRDTLINGEQLTYFKAIESEPSGSGTLYDVRFSRVESGGSYERAQSGINGVIYRWVGKGLGKYDTLRTLPRPKDHQMIALQTHVQPTKNLKIHTEIALSQFDLNRFSALDDSDNEDWAVLQQVDYQSKWGETAVQSSYQFKYSGENFRYFDRPEEVDFQRKWNLNQFRFTEQTIHDARTSFTFSPTSFYKAEAGLIRRTDLDGNRIVSDVNWDEQGWLGMRMRNEITASSEKFIRSQGDWQQHEAELFYRFSFNQSEFRPFLGALSDERIQKIQNQDSVLANSYGQYAAFAGLEWIQQRRFQMRYEFRVRDDASVLGAKFRKDSRNRIHQLDFKTIDTKNFETENSLSYQQRDITPLFRGQNGYSDTDAVFIKSNNRYRSENRAWQAQFLYDVNSQRTALLQETYIEVGPELGQYIWEDLNDDGIRQIDEFFPEQTPNEGTFLKQFLPSDELLPSIQLLSRLRMEIDPDRAFNAYTKNNWLKKVAEQIRWTGTLDIRENSTTNRLQDIYLMRLSRFLNDSTTIVGRIGFRSDLTLFKRNKKLSIRLGYNQIEGKNRQVFGAESQSINEYSIETQSQLTRKLQLLNELTWKSDTRNNSNLSSRNYRIKSVNWLNTWYYQQNRDIQWGLDWGYSVKVDQQLQTGASSQVWKVSANVRAYLGDKLQFSGRTQFRDINLNGETGALGNFELTEGAGEGANWLWNFQSTYRNSNLVQTSLSYDGRTITNRPTIHTVRFIVRALF